MLYSTRRSGTSSPSLRTSSAGGLHDSSLEHRMKGQLLFVAAVVMLGVALASSRTEAHKPITSPFTYNEDVFPIVRDRCGRCHVSGGVAPMSLLAYKDMVPWGESIRAELV